MKKTTSFIITLLVLLTIGLQTTPAQVILEHGSSVTSVVFSTDSILASGSSDGTVKLWNVESHENIATLEGHTRRVTSVAFSIDSILASGSSDGTVKLWNVESHENIATLEGHTGGVNSVAFSTNGTILASAGGSEIKLWDVTTHTNIATLEVDWFDDVTSVAFSPDGTTLASVSDNEIKLWDVTTHTNIATLGGRRHEVHSVAFSPDGTTLASGGDGSPSGEVKLWDVVTHQNTATLTVDWDDIYSVAFSPDGTLIASGGRQFFGDGAVKLWDVTTHENIAAFDSEHITSVAFSPDGTLLAWGSAAGKVKVWNVLEWTSTLEIISGNNQEGIIDTALANPLVVEVRDRGNNLLPDIQVTFKVTEGEGLLNGESMAVEVTTDANGRAAQTLTLGAIPGTNSVEVSIGNELVTFEAVGTSPYQIVKISGDEQQGTLGTALANPLVVEVRDRDDNPLPDLQVKFTVTDGLGLLSDRYTVKHVTTDANGRAAQTLTLRQAVGNTVRVSIGYESETFNAVGISPYQIAALEGHGDGVRAVAFSPDGTLLASGGGEGFQEAGTVKLWDVETHTNIATLYGHTGTVFSVSFSPDGSILASGSGDGTVKLWDVATKQNIATFKHAVDEVASVAFSPDGTLLASASLSFSFFDANLDDGTVELWDVATKQNIATLQVIATSVAFSPDGTLLASGTLDGTVELWDVATEQNIATLQGHTHWVWSVAFSPDGKTLASGALYEDATIKLWNVATRENIATLQAPGLSVAFSPDGTLLASASDVVELWDAVTGVNIATLQGHTDLVFSVAFSPDGKTLASGASDGTVKLWDVAEARQLTSVIPTVIPTVSISPSSMQSPAIGEQLTLSLNITNGVNVAGYQATVSFDRTALRYVGSANGDYLPADAFFGNPIIDWEYPRANLTLAANTLAGVGNGAGTLATLTFKVVAFKASTLTLSQVYLSNPHGSRWEATVESGEVTEPPEPAEKIFGDINHDSVVNIQDLAIVGSRFGERGQNSADVNGDGLVDIVDLVLVAGAFGGEAAAPLAHPQNIEMLTATEVQQWLSQAQQLALTDPAYLRGIIVLEQLFTALIPKETALLANYPNPFNPETWIPYQLAKPANVTLTIYAVDGQVVRQLALGHQPAGWYQTRSRAAYWDGRNEFGEPTTSGIYFYTFTIGEFTATRKMLILK